MAEGYAKLKLGETRDIVSDYKPAVSTETLSSCLVSIYDVTGAIAGGVSGVSATGITAGANADPQAWYTFVPLALSLPAARYIVSFQCTDSNGKVFVANVSVLVVSRWG